MWNGEEEWKVPEVLKCEGIRELHAWMEEEWDSVERSSCQTAAGRALWKHVIKDPVAEILAGEAHLKTLHDKMRRDKQNNAREISGVVLAVRTLWFDSKLEAAIKSFDGADSQVVLLGAGMDARAYRLNFLKDSRIFEVDLPKLLDTKTALIDAAMTQQMEPPLTLMAKSMTRVAADIREKDWLEKLQRCGFIPQMKTIWILEGILYYLHHIQALEVLRSIGANCSLTHTVLLADFMNKSLSEEPKYHFYSDWPEHLLPTLGFSHVNLSQIGDPDAHFGLFHDPLNLFNKLRCLPRSVQIHPEDGTPCRRLYLVQASGSPTTQQIE
ncbi:hypothetical protein AMTRI_Chr09g21140 [Amborella trichopoda]